MDGTKHAVYSQGIGVPVISREILAAGSAGMLLHPQPQSLTHPQPQSQEEKLLKKSKLLKANETLQKLLST